MDFDIVKGTILVRAKSTLIYRVPLFCFVFLILGGDLSLCPGVPRYENVSLELVATILLQVRRAKVENKFKGKQG